MFTKQYDSIVIGSGPAGEGASMKLAKCGQSVAIIEHYKDVGGGCTHWGTIPSKSLRHSVQMVGRFRADPIFRRRVGHIDVTWQELVKSAQSVIDDQVAMREEFYFRNRVDLYRGSAAFTDPHTLTVELKNGSVESIRAENIVIASGSIPYRPDDVNFDHKRICDSDSILNIDYVPRSVIIYGAGVIGCEYASIFGNLGAKVDLVNTRDRLLSFLDAEITDALGYHFREIGVTVRHDETYSNIEASDNSVVIDLASGKRFTADVLLWANGRSGATESLQLANANLNTNGRKQIDVDQFYRTEVPHIYAVGDVVGSPGLASASYDQGRFAGSHIGEGHCDNQLLTDIPTGIYTDPEISSIGHTESELTDRKVPYEVGRALFRSIARAQITGQTTGMIKILFHTGTLEILGIHCFGYQAAEIIHIGQAIMRQPAPGNKVTYFTENTFNYPTMAEAYRVAALNGLNRIQWQGVGRTPEDDQKTQTLVIDPIDKAD